jgi:hypothetical protein
MIINTQRRVVNIWTILTLIFIVCMFVPSWLGIPGMDGGFAISFFAGFMVMVGLIVVIIYKSRAKQMAKILSGEGRVATWHYTAEEWMRFAAIDFEQEKKLKRNLFWIVVGISIVVGLGLYAKVEDIIVAPIILGIIAIVAIPAIWAPRYRYNKLKTSEADVVISNNGLVVGTMFHLWVKLGASLDRISFTTDTNPMILTFEYSMPTRTGRQTEEARVPVPYGQYDEAVRVYNYFSSVNNKRRPSI